MDVLDVLKAKINIHGSDVMLVALTPTQFSVLNVFVLVLSKRVLVESFSNFLIDRSTQHTCPVIKNSH